jgi:hypothetical protein
MAGPEDGSNMLDQFLEEHRGEILALTEEKTLELAGDHPTSAQLKRGLPVFYRQVIQIIRRAADPAAPPAKDEAAIATAADKGDEPAMAQAAGQPAEAEVARSAGDHGREYLRLGYTLSHVVHAYGALCQAITAVATEKSAPISGAEFHALNRCLDVAIAGAVTEYQHAQDAADREGQPAGSLAHEMRNALRSAKVAFQPIKTGTVGTGGSTATLVERSLNRLEELIERLLTKADGHTAPKGGSR